MGDGFGIFRFTFEKYLQILAFSLLSDPVVPVAALGLLQQTPMRVGGAGRVCWPRHMIQTLPSDSERISWAPNN